MSFYDKYKWAIIAVAGTVVIHVGVLVYLNWKKLPEHIVYRRVEMDFRPVEQGEDLQDDQRDDKELTEEELNAKLENATVNFGQENEPNKMKSAAEIDAEIDRYINELAQGYQTEVDAKKQKKLEAAAQKLEELQKEQDRRNKDQTGEGDTEENIRDEADKGKAFMLGYLIEGEPSRYGMRVPAPSYVCKESGLVVIEIKVNQNGEVTTARVGSSVSIKGQSYSTSTSNECLISRALSYAKKSKFNENYSAPRSQSGFIVYRYGAQ